MVGRKAREQQAASWDSEWVALTVVERDNELAKRMAAAKASSRAVKKESE